MQYALTFLEGIISFISPCMLPMLPLYITYFAGGTDEKKKVLVNSLMFTLGFSSIFCILGLFAGSLGDILSRYRTVLNIIGGLLLIVFGLSFMNVIRLPIFKGIKKQHKVSGILSAFLFGVVYAFGLTPCVGAFLGAALVTASTSGTAIKGVLLLLCYSLGLGIPFVLSAVLVKKLEAAFSFIKKHYKAINIISGSLLIVAGILMMTGLWNILIG